MIGPETPQDGPEISPQQGLGSPLDPGNSQMVFGREITLQELEHDDYHIWVDDLDLCVEALSKFIDWDVTIHDTVGMNMRLAVAFKKTNDLNDFKIIFIAQEQKLQ